MNAPHGPDALEIHDVYVVLAAPHEEQLGVLGHATVSVGPFIIGSITVRITLEDRLIVTFPAKPWANGERHYYVVPTDPDLKRRIETAVIAAYVQARRRAGRAT